MRKPSKPGQDAGPPDAGPQPASEAPLPGTPSTDPFAPFEPETDLARQGSRPRGDPRRNTGDLPQPDQDPKPG